MLVNCILLANREKGSNSILTYFVLHSFISSFFIDCPSNRNSISGIEWFESVTPIFNSTYVDEGRAVRTT